MSAILPSSFDCCPTEFCDSPITVSVPGEQGPVSPPGESASGDMVGWFVKDNLDAARLVPAAADNRFLVMLGGSDAGDSFGGFFYWDPLSVALDNYNNFGGSVLNPFGNAGSGRWIRF